MEFNRLEDIMKKLYSQYPNRLNPDLVDLWAGAFLDLELEVFAKAVQNWTLKDTSGFPPVIGQIVAEVRKLIAPWLALSYEEAATECPRLYRKARKLAGLDRDVPYSPWADPNSLPNAYTERAGEKRAKEIFEELKDKYAAMPNAALVSLTARLEAPEQRKRSTLTAASTDGRGGKADVFDASKPRIAPEVQAQLDRLLGRVPDSGKSQEEFEAARRRQKEMVAGLADKNEGDA